MTDKKINTKGGAFVGEDVNVSSGGFVGRDAINTTNTSTNINGNLIVAVTAVLVVGFIGALALLQGRHILPSGGDLNAVTPMAVTTVQTPISTLRNAQGITPTQELPAVIPTISTTEPTTAVSNESTAQPENCTILSEDTACELEFGWAGGTANGDNPNLITFVKVIDRQLSVGSGGAGFIVKYDWKNGVLNGAITPDGTFWGYWIQDDSDGGEFRLTFNADGTEATGWWNYKGAPQQNRAILRIRKR